MIDMTSRTDGVARISTQPVVLAAVTLILILVGIGSVVLWRTYTGNSPEQERIASARQLQARTAQASEQLVEKTKGLEVTQQESIDQLQVVQDQLQTVKRLVAAQQADTKRLSEQISALTEAISGLRQSFASASATETSASSGRTTSARPSRRAITRNLRRRPRSHS